MSSTLTQNEPGPKPSAIQRYREAVFDAVDSGRDDDPDQDILEAAWKLDVDVTADMKSLPPLGWMPPRTSARRSPSCKLRPSRLAEVASTAAAVGEGPSVIRHRPGPALCALNEVPRHATPGAVSPQKLAATQAAAEVGRVRHSATVLLRDNGRPGPRPANRRVVRRSRIAGSVRSGPVRKSCTSTGRSPNAKRRCAGTRKTTVTFYAEAAATRRASSASCTSKRVAGLRNCAAWPRNDRQPRLRTPRMKSGSLGSGPGLTLSNFGDSNPKTCRFHE